jgi:SHS2 domain-containing protein
MSCKFNFIDHTADIAVEVEGDTIADLFIASASAWQESVVEKNKINFFIRKEIFIEGMSYEDLLVSFLDELNFLLLTKKWVSGNINEIEIKKTEDRFYLKAEIAGENIDENKHQIKVEIKAVTYHQMEIKKIKNKYSTRIVFDI